MMCANEQHLQIVYENAKDVIKQAEAIESMNDIEYLESIAISENDKFLQGLAIKRIGLAKENGDKKANKIWKFICQHQRRELWRSNNKQMKKFLETVHKYDDMKWWKEEEKNTNFKLQWKNFDLKYAKKNRKYHKVLLTENHFRAMDSVSSGIKICFCGFGYMRSGYSSGGYHYQYRDYVMIIRYLVKRLDGMFDYKYRIVYYEN